MPRVPKESLGGRMVELLKRSFNSIYVYSVFVIILIEIITIKLADLNNYLIYWYPLLSQLIAATLLFCLGRSCNKLRYCLRKKIALYVLSFYYLIGFFSVLFQIHNNLYSNIITSLLLGVSFLLILLSFRAD